MKHSVRRLVTVLATTAALAAPGVAAATSASAATYTCNDSYGGAVGQAIKPAYHSGSSYITSCYMAPGADNDGVYALQLALVLCYDRDIATDGSYGPATKAALKYAQGKEHVTADGFYGPATASVLHFATHDGVRRVVC
ncbi:peptidoglycan-binding domain-containing protein [Luteimicrobium subarcticum]|nr:peptidoglycan-binding domain-containing protein [Luteimicrobium subarcticum]